MIIAMDFDGVLYDGGNECLLVAWNTFNKNTISYFNETILNDIPDEFRNIFKKSRNYIRHDGHFIVPFYFNTVDDINHDEFDKVYNGIPEAEKDEFKFNFSLYRRMARDKYPCFWRDLHSELISLKDIMGIDSSITINIVSGKDVDSITFILNSNEINIPNERVFGSLKNKDKILLSIKKYASENNERFVFIDDNINNVIDSLEVGVDSLWAEWGYHTEAQEKLALELSVKTVSKDNIISLIKKIKMEEY